MGFYLPNLAQGATSQPTKSSLLNWVHYRCGKSKQHFKTQKRVIYADKYARQQLVQVSPHNWGFKSDSCKYNESKCSDTNEKN